MFSHDKTGNFDIYPNIRLNGENEFVASINSPASLTTRITGSKIHTGEVYTNHIYANLNGNRQKHLWLYTTNIQGRESFIVMDLFRDTVTSHQGYYKSISLYGNIMGNSCNLFNFDKIYGKDITTDWLHADSINTQNIRIQDEQVSNHYKQIRFNHDELKWSNSTTYESYLYSSKSFLKINNTLFSYHTRDGRYTNDYTQIFITQNIFSTIYKSKINLRAGRSSKIIMTGNSPLNNMDDNSLQKIEIYGSIYLPNVDENTPGFDFTNYTQTQITTMSTTPLQGVVINLLKRIEDLENELNSLR